MRCKSVGTQARLAEAGFSLLWLWLRLPSWLRGQRSGCFMAVGLTPC